MKKITLQPGFTLVELTISIGIFIVIFVSMTQIFFLMQGTIARINAQREMVAWMSTITQTIATDLETYAISVEESDASTLTLVHPKTTDKVRYHIKTTTREGQPEDAFSREVLTAQGTRISTYTSPLFYFPDVRLRVTPDKQLPKERRCALFPAVTVRFEVAGDPKDQRLAALGVRALETSFSSNAYPLTYSQTCLTQ